MARKRIAVFIASIDKQYQQVFSAGLKKASVDYDVDICIFNCLGFSDTNDDYGQEESVIYDLPDIYRFDGIVTLYATQANAMAKDRLMRILHTYPEKPHISIDVPMENAVLVSFDDMSSMRELTRYLVGKENRKSFAFVQGPENNIVSNMRLQACREALKEYGMELPDSMVAYGDWTHDGGYDATGEILKNGMPDVIMCANDYMAFGAHERLRREGVAETGQIHVTGFDAIREAVALGLATINRPVDKAADLAIALLKEWIDGRKPEKDAYLLPTEISYGGLDEESVVAGSVYGRLQTVVDDYRTVLDALSEMGVSSRRLAGVGEIAETGKAINMLARSLGMEDVHVCVDQKAFESEEYNRCARAPYPEKMYLLSGYRGKEPLPQIHFSTANLLPMLTEENRPPVCMVFCPLQLRQLNYGYIAMSYNHVTGEPLYPALMMICGALNSLRLQQNLRKSAAMVEHMALHDSMTGMLNRRGYDKYVFDTFRQAKKNHEHFVIMSVDMDRLKFINDRYGHQAGDEAICRMGKALLCLEGEGFTCVHISGDEFLAYGVCSEAMQASELQELVEQKLEIMNERDPWLCDISASMGVYAAVPEETDTPDSFLTQADRNMYEIKRRKQRSGIT